MATAQRQPIERKQLLVAADQLECPSCREPLRRIHPGEGSLLITCRNNLEAKPGERYGERCGQHIYVATGRKGFSNVLAIDEHEHAILSANRVVPAPADALTILGVLTSRTPDTVPTYPCAKCHASTQLTDLFGGQCRSCAGLVGRA